MTLRVRGNALPAGSGSSTEVKGFDRKGVTLIPVPGGLVDVSVEAEVLDDGGSYVTHPWGCSMRSVQRRPLRWSWSMELRRLGMARKPAIVVPDHMLNQFAREWLQLYPQAQILAASSADLAGDKSRQFVARAAANDWDAVIMTRRL